MTKRFFLYVVHNCVAHPMLVIANISQTISTRLTNNNRFLLLAYTAEQLTDVIHLFHDKTNPINDVRNQHLFTSKDA